MEPLIKKIRIKGTDSNESETIHGEQVTEDTFKLLENPISNCKINYGTVVKVIPDKDGELIMSKIVRASTFKTRQFFLDPNANIVDWGIQIGKPIIDAGGMWEIVMKGICFIHLPKDSTFDLDGFFEQNNYYPSEIIEDI